jgi:hypothetical protein
MEITGAFYSHISLLMYRKPEKVTERDDITSLILAVDSLVSERNCQQVGRYYSDPNESKNAA